MAAPIQKRSKEEIQAMCLKGDLSKQWEWHEAFRDASKNVYRSSIQDNLQNREVAVKSDFPSGYGGHVATRGHDMLYLNTAEYEKLVQDGLDPNRDSFPSFKQQKYGVATFTQYGAAETPTYGSLPDCRVMAPWGMTLPVRENPSYKVKPCMDARQQ